VAFPFLVQLPSLHLFFPIKAPPLLTHTHTLSLFLFTKHPHPSKTRYQSLQTEIVPLVQSLNSLYALGKVPGHNSGKKNLKSGNARNISFFFSTIFSCIRNFLHLSLSFFPPSSFLQFPFFLMMANNERNPF